MTESEIPLLSLFKFQFWPKDCTTHSALNYTGHFSVKYIMQQRMVRKSHDDDHYINAIYKYAQQYVIDIRDWASFICIDDKHKILLSEPGFPLSALPCSRRVLVGKNQVFQVRDHDFSTISLIPTVILLNTIPETVDGSWYWGKPMIFLKISVTDQLSALRTYRTVWVKRECSSSPYFIYRQRTWALNNIFKCEDGNDFTTKIFWIWTKFWMWELPQGIHSVTQLKR